MLNKFQRYRDKQQAKAAAKEVEGSGSVGLTDVIAVL
jgi:hypothetical protein